MPFLITSLIVLMLVSFCEPITLWIPSCLPDNCMIEITV